jgi:hypothetical protein
VSGWEYTKIALNELPRKNDDIDVLCDAGEDGWELVAILPNNTAYLKRQVDGSISETTAAAEREGVVRREEVSESARPERAYEVKAKYRDPKTTWSGRGRMATWLKRKQDAGEDIDRYLV